LHLTVRNMLAPIILWFN